MWPVTVEVAKVVVGKIWQCMGQGEESSSPPKSMTGMNKSQFALRRGMGAEGNGRSEGRGNEPSQTDTRYGMLAVSTLPAKRRWKAPIVA